MNLLETVPLPPFESALTPEFFSRDPVVIARELIGCRLVRHFEDGYAMVRIVETEAYDCPIDPSCYVIERLPGAKEALRGPPGRYYFHKSYEHFLLNVVCQPLEYEATILIRAVEPMVGLEHLQKNRTVKKDLELTNGPAKLVQALELYPRFAGLEVNQPDTYFAPGKPVPEERVTITARVGLSVGRELPWRFFETGNRWVSSGKPSS